jgi:hypothetical protein
MNLEECIYNGETCGEGDDLENLGDIKMGFKEMM